MNVCVAKNGNSTLDVSLFTWNTSYTQKLFWIPFFALLFILLIKRKKATEKSMGETERKNILYHIYTSLSANHINTHPHLHTQFFFAINRVILIFGVVLPKRKKKILLNDLFVSSFTPYRSVRSARSMLSRCNRCFDCCCSQLSSWKIWIIFSFVLFFRYTHIINKFAFVVDEFFFYFLFLQTAANLKNTKTLL